jgi:hypothetical protein
MSGLGVIWLYFKLPETKGKSLEEITKLFAGRQPKTRKKLLEETKVEDRNGKRYEMRGHTNLSTVLETKNSYNSIISEE